MKNFFTTLIPRGCYLEVYNQKKYNEELHYFQENIVGYINERYLYVLQSGPSPTRYRSLNFINPVYCLKKFRQSFLFKEFQMDVLMILSRNILFSYNETDEVCSKINVRFEEKDAEVFAQIFKLYETYWKNLCLGSEEKALKESFFSKLATVLDENLNAGTKKTKRFSFTKISMEPTRET